MRTSLNELKEAEDYLMNNTSAEDSLLFQARVILSPVLAEKLEWQRKTYRIINLYSRSELKKETEMAFQKLFNKHSGNAGFRQKILQIFNKTHKK